MEAVRATSAFELIVSPVRDEIELGRTIAMAGRHQSGGLISLPDSFLNSRHEMIVALTANGGKSSRKTRDQQQGHTP
jgi:hypothetical protein